MSDKKQQEYLSDKFFNIERRIMRLERELQAQISLNSWMQERIYDLQARVWDMESMQPVILDTEADE